MVCGKAAPFAGRSGNVDLRLAGARRRHSRPAWRLVGDNRVLDEEKRGGLPANARILRLGPHGPQASQGVCGSLLHLVDRLKNGTRGTRRPRKGADDAANEAGVIAQARLPARARIDCSYWVRPRVVSVAEVGRQRRIRRSDFE